MFILYLKIFLARILDVSLGTVRTMYIIKGQKFKTCFIAFFEILIWFYAASIALVSDESSIFIAVSYALGFTTGTYIGMLINDFLNKDMLKINIIFRDLKNEYILNLKEYNLKIRGNEIILFLSKNKVPDLLKRVKEMDQDAFIYSSNIRIM